MKRQFGVTWSDDYIESLTARFWGKVDKKSDPSACWPWLGWRQKNRGGHGEIRVMIEGEPYTEKAHRVAYFLENGCFERSLTVIHTCDDPGCVNPAHLFLGTRVDSVRQMYKRGRQTALMTKQRFCRKGHDKHVTGEGKWRQCLACIAAKRKTPRPSPAEVASA